MITLYIFPGQSTNVTGEITRPEPNRERLGRAGSPARKITTI